MFCQWDSNHGTHFVEANEQQDQPCDKSTLEMMLTQLKRNVNCLTFLAMDGSTQHEYSIESQPDKVSPPAIQHTGVITQLN